ncbi:MAG TPA: hypothetical protein VFQ44_11125 [Streptosporangiaceae bacterium]|nr:hypothetical protein [Streptosporangiaceae bacterium]
MWSASMPDASFGESAESVHSRLGAPKARFNRTPDSGPTDLYAEHGAMLTYGSDGLLSYIELVPPADPRWNDIQLLDRPFADVARDLREAGLDGEPYDSGLDYPQIGMRLYTSHPGSPELPVESVGLYPAP